MQAKQHDQGGLDGARFAAFIDGRTEPAWLADRRKADFAAYEAAEQPDWRRTTLKNFNPGAYTPARADVTISWDGGPEGVVVLPLAEALAQHSDLVREVFGTAVRSERDKYSALNNALVSDGVFVYVPKNVAVEAPVSIQYRVRNAGDLAGVRTLGVLGANAAITITEEYVSEFDGAALVLGGAEFALGAGAHLTFSSVQNLGAEVVVLGSQQLAFNGNDTQADWLNIVIGSAVQHMTLEAQLNGNGSNVRWNGLLYGNKAQNLLVAPTLNHVGLNTEGQINFKTVVDDTAYAVFDGMVRIPKTGQGTNSDLRESALHLSKTSRSDSIPGLEIDANEVKAGHGSTSGQIDEEQLFYLMSRGLPFAEAKRTIVLGFVGEIIDLLTDEALHERIEAVVADKI